MKLGERIRFLRESVGMTQTALADASGTTKQNIYKYETGIITNIPSDRVEAIAVALQTSPAHLMGWEDQPSAPPVNGDEELTEYLEHLRTRPEMKMLFSLTKTATKEDVEKAVKIIEALLGK